MTAMRPDLVDAIAHAIYSGRFTEHKRMARGRWERETELARAQERALRWSLHPNVQALFVDKAAPEFDEDNCPGHVASTRDAKVCARCGTHIDSLRPPDDEP